MHEHCPETTMTPEEYLAFHERRLEMILGLFERNLPEKIERTLNVGGAGDLLELSRRVQDGHGGEAHIVDVDDTVEAASAKGFISKYCNVDTDPLPYEDGYFDFVIFCSVIEHLYNPTFALSEIARVLKPGGILLLEAPNATSFGRRVDVIKGRNPFRWFNRYNALEGKSVMIFCSVFYTTDEAQALLAGDYEIMESAFGRHTPPLAFWKRFIHEGAVRLFPAMSDCFAIMARKK